MSFEEDAKARANLDKTMNLKKNVEKTREKKNLFFHLHGAGTHRTPH
jgi:hypothetical protein